MVLGPRSASHQLLLLLVFVFGKIVLKNYARVVGVREGFWMSKNEKTSVS
jgi:hypothetical protein